MPLQIPLMLKREHSVLEGAVLEEWEQVRLRMEQEIEIRLKQALVQISDFFPKTLQGRMVHRAPYELIEMFNDL